MQKIKNKSIANNSGESGITLIALVVTIVVTLILAGIAINTSIGNKGIIKEARDTQANLEQAQNEGLEQIEDIKKEEKAIEDGIQHVPDTTAPNIIDITFTKLGKTTVTVNVEVVEEESGIAKIEYIAKEGTNEITSGEIQEKSYKFSELKFQTEYTITVKVTDKAGNESELTKNVTTL